jgi:hypothetical protein
MAPKSELIRSKVCKRLHTVAVALRKVRNIDRKCHCFIIENKLFEQFVKTGQMARCLRYLEGKELSRAHRNLRNDPVIGGEFFRSSGCRPRCFGTETWTSPAPGYWPGGIGDTHSSSLGQLAASSWYLDLGVSSHSLL